MGRGERCGFFYLLICVSIYHSNSLVSSEFSKADFLWIHNLEIGILQQLNDYRYYLYIQNLPEKRTASLVYLREKRTASLVTSEKRTKMACPNLSSIQRFSIQ